MMQPRPMTLGAARCLGCPAPCPNRGLGACPAPPSSLGFALPTLPGGLSWQMIAAGALVLFLVWQFILKPRSKRARRVRLLKQRLLSDAERARMLAED